MTDRRQYPARSTAIATGRVSRERSCDGKLAYRTPDYAERMARKASRIYGTPQTFYFCAFCQQYHLATDTSGGA